MNIQVSEIGYVKNNVNKRTDENWRNVTSEIILNQEFHGGLEGLKGFSNVIILTYLHEAKYNKEKHLKRHPRNLSEMPLVGIFSQRAKDRPNPIGITAVKIIDVTDKKLIVQGLDAINGTPVLDIKPYYPHYDRIDNASVPQWVNDLMKNYF